MQGVVLEAVSKAAAHCYHSIYIYGQQYRSQTGPLAPSALSSTLGR